MKRSHRELVAWQKAVDLVEHVYLVTAFFPKQEVYGLVSQMRRAAVSIPSNIAEGAASASSREFVRYLSIACASCAELDTQIEIVRRMGWLTDQQLQQQLDEVNALSVGLLNAIRNKIQR